MSDLLFHGLAGCCVDAFPGEPVNALPCVVDGCIQGEGIARIHVNGIRVCPEHGNFGRVLDGDGVSSGVAVVVGHLGDTDELLDCRSLPYGIERADLFPVVFDLAVRAAAPFTLYDFTRVRGQLVVVAGGCLQGNVEVCADRQFLICNRYRGRCLDNVDGDCILGGVAVVIGNADNALVAVLCRCGHLHGLARRRSRRIGETDVFGRGGTAAPFVLHELTEGILGVGVQFDFVIDGYSAVVHVGGYGREAQEDGVLSRIPGGVAVVVGDLYHAVVFLDCSRRHAHLGFGSAHDTPIGVLEVGLVFATGVGVFGDVTQLVGCNGLDCLFAVNLYGVLLGCEAHGGRVSQQDERNRIGSFFVIIVDSLEDTGVFGSVLDVLTTGEFDLDGA